MPSVPLMLFVLIIIAFIIMAILLIFTSMMYHMMYMNELICNKEKHKKLHVESPNNPFNLTFLHLPLYLDPYKNFTGSSLSYFLLPRLSVEIRVRKALHQRSKVFG